MQPTLHVVSQVVVDDSEGSPAHTVINALISMEHRKPGSCEVLVTKLLQKLARYVCSFTFLIYSLNSQTQRNISAVPRNLH